jgi:hypothetical protein
MTDNVVSRATAALAQSVGSIIGSDGDDATKHAALAETFEQFQTYLGKNGGIGKVDHHASTVANLLVEAGTFPHRTAALHYLLNKPGGRALMTSLQKAQTEKVNSSMDTTEKLTAKRTDMLLEIGKRDGAIAMAKVLVADDDAHGISEEEYTQIVTEYAKRAFPNDRPDVAFGKVFEQNEVIRRGHQVVNAKARYAPKVDTAYEELRVKAAEYRKVHPELSEAQSFERVYSDRSNIELAERERQESSALR